MTARRDPTLTDKLCAMILAHWEVPHEVAKQMTRADILALVHTDHDPVPFAIARDLGWTPDQYNHPSNLRLRLVDDHLAKTRRKDVPGIAKAKRITREHIAFRQRLLARDEPTTEKPRSRWGSRKMQSRPFRSVRRPQ